MFSGKIEVRCKMYYVVYLIHFDLHVALPYTWVRDPIQTLEMIMYHGIGLKRNKVYWCFSSENANAQIEKNGELIPNIEFQPNFDAPASRKFPCHEGMYMCRIVELFGKYIQTRQKV